MRATLRAQLIQVAPEFQGRVFEPHAATKDTPLPFLTVSERLRNPGEQFAAGQISLEVWPYMPRETFRSLDAEYDKLKRALHWHVLYHDGRPYLLEVQPSAGDAFDTDWGALTKPMQIEAFDLSFIVSAATRREPLVSALNAWVRSSWPGQPSIDDVQPHDRIPPVFWRVQDRPAVLEMTNAVTWLQVRLRAHILCASPSDRVLWTRRVTEALVLKREVLLPDGGCLYFDGVGADSEQHPATAGQIILTGRYAVEVQERKFPVVETIETSVTTGG